MVKLQKKLCAAVCLCTAASNTAPAAESGAGLYVPGTIAFGAGSTPPPGVYVTQGMLYYDGDATVSIEGGSIDINARKTAAPIIANVMWVAQKTILDGRLGLSVSLPYTSYTRLKADSSTLGANVETSGWGLGDISFKAQLGWNKSDGFSHTISTTVWLPSGRYETGFSPSGGKNHYGVNFAWGSTKLWEDPGIEFSSSIGLTSEFSNTATHYRNGLALNADVAVGEVFDNGLTLGVAGYAYKQITNDTGSGATLGAFRGRAFAIGPALSYTTRIGNRPLIIAARYYQEFGVQNRFGGNMTTVSITTRF